MVAIGLFYPKYIPSHDLGYIWDTTNGLDVNPATADNSGESRGCDNLGNMASKPGIKVINSFILSMFLLLLLSSCSGLDRDGVSDTLLPPTPVRGVLATTAPISVTSLPVVTTAAAELTMSTAVPTVTNDAPKPLATEAAVVAQQSGFSDLRFALTADSMAQGEFPPGTEEVYAIWEYMGMSPSDTIRRIWFRDDQIWLTREEGWNWGEYGSEGTMRDVSVYDNEGSGLPPAIYRLQLYVNDELQQEALFVINGS